MPREGIEVALEQAAVALNSFINSVEWIGEGGTGDSSLPGASALVNERGAGFYAVDPYTLPEGASINGDGQIIGSDGEALTAAQIAASGIEQIKVDDIDGQYKGGKITETVTNVTQLGMSVEQADRSAKKQINNVLG